MELHSVYSHGCATWWYATALCCGISTLGALIFMSVCHTSSSSSLSFLTIFLLITASCLALAVGFIMVFTCVRNLAFSWSSRMASRPLPRPQQPLEQVLVQPSEQPLKQVSVQPLEKAPSLPSLNLELDFSCPICFSIVADEVCIPCGHVFCEGCLNNLNGQCAICREEIYMTQKMYL